jgi:hypothetical protein
MQTKSSWGVIGAAFAVWAIGCGEMPGQPAATAEPVEEHPAAALSFNLDNGNTIELFDIKGNVLVSETGPAGQNPALRAAKAAAGGSLVSLFHILKPNAEMPQMLADLDARMAQAPALTDDAEPVEEDSRAGAPIVSTATTIDDGVQREQSAVLQGCSNGCCDPDWTLNYLCNTVADIDNRVVSYSWYDFDWGWSQVKLNSRTYSYDGIACSAVGTSQYTVSISGGGGGSWSVAEGYWREFDWWIRHDTRSITAGVNSSGNQHLHMFCGAKLE